MLLRKMPNPSSQLDAIFRAFPDLLFTVDESGVILDYRAGEAVSTLFVPPEAFLGQRAEDVLPHEFADSLAAALKELKAGRGPIAFEYSVRQGGVHHWFEARLVPTGQGQVAVVVRDDTRHKEAEEKIKAQLKRMAALRAIDLTISSSLDLNLALSVILSQVTAQLEVDAADILLLNPKQELEFATGVGFRSDSRPQVRLKLGEGFAGKVAADQKSLNVADVRRGKTGVLNPPRFLEEGFRCYYGVPLMAKGGVRGVLEIFHRSLLHPDGEWLDYMETLAGQAAIAIENGMLLRELQRTNLELTLAYNTTIEGWSRALDLRDRDTEGHTQRVTQASVKLGRRLGLTESELIHIRRGAMLHDIGKMAIPDSILLKPGPLSPEEWEVIHQHARYAYELLWPISYLGPSIDIPHFHHERWDGSGYPDGLKGNEIPLAARLFAVIDVFDALTSTRPYRPAWERAAAMQYIREQAGKLFDPDVTDVFLQMLESGELAVWMG